MSNVPPHSLDPATTGILLAAGELVALSLLTAEPHEGEEDVRVAGRAFRYLPRFWTLTGVLEVAADGVRPRTHSPEQLASARLRVAAEWVRAGASPVWARAEATAALQKVLGRRLPPWPES